MISIPNVRAAAVIAAGVVALGGLAALVTSQTDGARERPVQAAAPEPVAVPATVAAPAAPAVPAAGAEPVALAPGPQFTQFRVGDRNVKDLLVDPDHTVWIGTSGGVVRYNPRTDEHETLDNTKGLLANGVFHLSRIEGRVAVGTYGGGLSLLREAGGFETFNVPEGLGDAFVYDALIDARGDLWIATWSGVNRVRGGALRDASQWELYTVENTGGGLPNDWVYGLANGANGEVWMATEGGLARFVDGQWTNWKHSDGLGAPYELVKADIGFDTDPAQVSEHHARQKVEMGLQNVDVAYNPNYIVALWADADGGVWAGTWGGGLSHFDGQRWHVYTTRDGLPANHVFALHRDDQGRLWIGTSAGLVQRLPDGSFRTYTTQQGLYSDAVFSLASAPNDTLWVGSFGGVTRFVGLQ